MELLMDDSQLRLIVDRILAAHAEMIRRNVPPGDATIMAGCALGTLLSGTSS